MSIENYTDDELIEALQAAQDCFADTISQYRNEVAQFGDAWVGADAQLDEARAGMAELDAEIAKRFPVEDAKMSHIPRVECDDDYTDLPF